MPIRLSETWGDKFVDKLPVWLWPKVRIAYYIFSVAFPRSNAPSGWP